MMDEDGKVYTCGSNSNGQLGFEIVGNRKEPTPIQDVPNMQSIAAGLYSTVIVDVEGKPYYFGYDPTTGGRVCTPTLIPGLPPIRIAAAGENHTVLIDEEGKAYSRGSGFKGRLGLGDNEDRDAPTLIPDLVV